MSHKLLRLTSKLFNTPHLMESQALNAVLSVLDSRNSGDFELRVKTPEEKKSKKKELQYNQDTRVGIISVDGPLTYIEYAAVCGEEPSSYQSIESQFDQLIDAGAKTVILTIASPGGEAYGMMETGRYMRKKADENNIKLLSYVDGLAASAGYGLAASAHEVIANPESELGSIGVVVRLRNVNKAMQSMGVEDTYIYAGNSKIPFTEEGEWREDFLDDIQGKVEALYEAFAQYVADMRGIGIEAVKATEAKTFLAEQAVALKLADKTMTREEFFNYLADNTEVTPMLGKLLGKKEEKVEMVELEALQAQMADLTAKLDDAEKIKAEALAAIATMKEELSAANEALAQYRDAEAAIAEAAVKAKKDAREAAMSALLSVEEVQKLSATFESLDDAAFEAVMDTYRVRASAEDAAFKEIGFEGDKPAKPAANADNALARLMREKGYGV